MGQYKLIFVTRCIIQRNVWYTFELKKKHSQYKMAGKALTLILLTFITKSASQGCGDTQKCVLLSDCPFAKETLEEASKSTDINEKFNLFKSIYELRCKEESEPMVCCEKVKQETSSPEKSSSSESIEFNDDQWNYCGKTFEDRKSAAHAKGENTKIKTHPWIVSIQHSDGSLWCGGSIVSSNKVVTAAHCFKKDEYRENLDKFRIVVGKDKPFAFHGQLWNITRQETLKNRFTCKKRNIAKQNLNQLMMLMALKDGLGSIM